MSPLAFLQQPLRWLSAISRYQATTSGGPNFAYEMAVNKASPEKLQGLDLSSWQVAFTGAEPIRAETLDRFVETFEPYGFRREALYPCYGMAESTLIISGSVKSSPPVLCHLKKESLERNCVERVDPGHGDILSDDVQTVVSCGHSVTEQNVVIVDPQSLAPCPPGRVGEIWVSGGSIAQGYWNQPEATKNYFQAYLADGDDGPFMRTGDLGFLDGDHLFVTGRLKDLLIIRGRNHYPQDIEQTVASSHSALRPNAGAAFSIELGQSERLIVVQEVERSHVRKLNAEEVLQCIRQAVTATHSLETYAIALVKPGNIPITSSGKVRRRACKAAFLTSELNVVADWSRDPRRKANFKSLQSQINTVFKQIRQDVNP